MRIALREKLAIFAVIVNLCALSSTSAIASTNACSSTGYSVLPVNGVFTDEDGARYNANILEKMLPRSLNNENVSVQYLFNPSHLAGLGDVIDSTIQKALDQWVVNDYDLGEIRKSASEQISTQKVLLVGYSQGNFYANGLYDSIANKPSGVPSQSLGVYGVATPASRVGGDGKWITSDTDKVIAGLVSHATLGTLKVNTHIDLQKGDDIFGHSFTDVYLKHKGAQIVTDIKSSLSALAANSVQNPQSPCVAPPLLGPLHRAEGLLLKVADPVASLTVQSVVGVGSAAVYVAKESTKSVVAGVLIAGAAVENAALATGSAIARGASVVGSTIGQAAVSTVDIMSLVFSGGSKFGPAIVSESVTTTEKVSEAVSESRSIVQSDTARASDFNQADLAQIGEPKAADSQSNSVTVVFNTTAPVNIDRRAGNLSGAPTQNSNDSGSVLASSASYYSSPPSAPAPAPPVSAPNLHSSFAPPPPPNPPPAYVNLVFPSSVSADQEVVATLSAVNLSAATYDIKISIETTNLEGESEILSNIFDGTEWKSSNYYLASSITGPTVSGHPVRLTIRSDKLNFIGQANVLVKIRKSGSASASQMFSGVINIASPVVSPPTPPPPSLAPEPPPAPATEPEPAPEPTPPPVPVPPPSIPATNHLLISQVQVSGVTGGDELIELYNPTDQNILLDGWSIQYLAGTATAMTDSNVYKKNFDSTHLVKAKSYFLIGRGLDANQGDGYVGAKTADLSERAFALSGASTGGNIFLVNSSVKLSSPTDSAIIDQVSYGDPVLSGVTKASLPDTRQSIVRKYWRDGLCLANFDSVQIVGNGCDTDNNAEDFVIAMLPNPRNSGDLPEPRRAPSAVSATPGADLISYDHDRLNLIFSWAPSVDYSGSSVGIRYEIKNISDDADAGDVVLTENTSATKVINQVGRDYAFSIAAVDSAGLVSDVIEQTISVPNMLSSLSFYEDPRTAGRYLVEGKYAPSNLIAPNIYYQDGSPFQMVVFYLNSDAFAEHQDIIEAHRSTEPDDSSKTLAIDYRRCDSGFMERRSLLLSTSPSGCISGSYNGATARINWEDKNFTISAIPPAGHAFTSDDYITAAYYDLYYIGWGGMQLKFAAADRTKYYFQNSPPPHSPPAVPTNVAVISSTPNYWNQNIFDVVMSIDKATDPDTIDAYLGYEYSIDGADFLEMHGVNMSDDTHAFRQAQSLAGDHQVLIRAFDEFGNRSPSFDLSISINPPEPPPVEVLAPDANNL